VRNSFTYHYAVTAFDLNSVKSGPTSLESPRVTKSVIPRGVSGQETAGLLQAARSQRRVQREVFAFGAAGEDSLVVHRVTSSRSQVTSKARVLI